MTSFLARQQRQRLSRSRHRRKAPEKENVDSNEPDQAEAEPSTHASWAGKLGKWAAALKPAAAAAPLPKQEVPPQNEAEVASDAAAAISTANEHQRGNDKAAGEGPYWLTCMCVQSAIAKFFLIAPSSACLTV